MKDIVTGNAILQTGDEGHSDRSRFIKLVMKDIVTGHALLNW